VGAWRLRRADAAARELDDGERFSSGPGPNAETLKVVASLGKTATLLRDTPRSRHLAVLRQHMDQMFDDRQLDAKLVPADAGGVAGEWVLAPGADPARRMLYIHGGAFMLGSPRSHRNLTVRLSELTGGAVLAIDYRLMPEHPRLAGLLDCRSAYLWMLDNGPDGAAPARAVFVGGDSAGGNLTLSLIAWVRDRGHRAPDAALALSPATDMSLGSPSLKTNLHSDAMLGPMFGKLAKVPRVPMVWGTWAQHRMHPLDVRMSPLHGDLSRLPPLLVQASTAEMLLDDARRYVAKARAAGSPAKLQTWDHVPHVWQIFNPELPEAREALAQIGSFLNAAAPR
jgi:acetyl esterase/lipase